MTNEELAALEQLANQTNQFIDAACNIPATGQNHVGFNPNSATGHFFLEPIRSVSPYYERYWSMRDELIDLELFLWVQEGNSPDTFVFSGDAPSSFLEDFVSVYEAIIQALEANGHVAYGTTNFLKNSITIAMEAALAAADGKISYGDVGKIYGSTLGAALGLITAPAAIKLLSTLLSASFLSGFTASVAAFLGPLAPLFPYALSFVAIGLAAHIGAELGASYFTQFGDALENFLRPYQGSLSEKADWVKKLLVKLDLAQSTNCPLILDLDGDGIETTNLVNSQTGKAGTEAVYWDIDNDGFREASAWVGKDDGLLARDVNGNGMIDDHSELFGSNTQNGFSALKAYADSNNDNQITATDANFSNLLVWQDVNGDGVTQPGELKTLSELGITSINLSATALSGVTNNDNPVSHHSTFVMNGQTRNVDDVWFKYDNANSIDTMPYTSNPDTFLLPELRGYGDVSKLSIAMSKDPALLAQMQEISSATLATLISPSFGLEGKITALMFRWAGVNNISPTGRGDWDAQKLGFLEKFLGTVFTGNVGGGATIRTLTQAWGIAYNAVMARIVFQSSGSQLFTAKPKYNYATDTFSGSYVLDGSAIMALTSGQSLVTQQSIYAYIFKMIDGMVGIEKIDEAAKTTLSNIIASTDPTNQLNYNFFAAAVGFSTDQIIFGTVTNDTLSVSNNPKNNELLYGGAGNDVLTGGVGFDTFLGSVGDDTLYGGAGDDTYYYNAGDGSDVINEDASWTGAADKVIFGTGLSSQNVNISFSGWDATLTFTGYSGSLQIIAQTFGRDIGIEQFVFSDGVTWSRADLVEHCILQQEASGAVSIYGTNDNNVIRGNSANNILYGGAGNDTYYYNIGDGNDIIDDGGNWTGNNDRVILGTGLNSSNVNVAFAGADMTLTFTGYSNSLVLCQEDASADRGIEWVTFGDGAVWSRTAFMDRYVLQQEMSGAATIRGTGSDNTIHGNSANNVLNGLGGNDTYYYNIGDGNDIIDDGGNWTGNNDRVILGTGLNSSNVNVAFAGADMTLTFTGYSNSLVLCQEDASADRGIEWVTFGDGAVWSRTAFMDRYVLQQEMSGAATIRGTGSDNTIHGNSANNVLNGLGGNDTYYYNIGDGNDIIDDGGNWTGNNDRVILGTGLNSSNVNVAFAGADMTLTFTGYSNSLVLCQEDASADRGIEWVTFGDGAVWSRADFVNKYVLQQETSGSITINGTNASNIFHGNSANNILNGYDGNDTFYGNIGNDTFNGGKAFDTVDYSSSTTTALINLSASSQTLNGAVVIAATAKDGLGGTDTISGVEKVIGSSFADWIYGSVNDDTFIGGAGNDVLAGGAGVDTLNGDAGDDILIGGAGNDVLSGGAGIDTADFSSATATALINLSTASQTLNGTAVAAGTARDGLAGTDTLSGIEKIVGSVYADWMYGSANADTITGGAGNDNLTGGLGNDQYLFNTGFGADTITDTDSTAGNADVIGFGSGFSKQNLWFSQSGNNLLVNVLGTTNSITVSNWYSGTANQIEQFTTSDGMKLDSQLAQLVTAMASYAANNSGFNPTSATVMPTDTTLQTAITAAWHA